MTDTNRHDQHTSQESGVIGFRGVAEQHMQLLCLKLAQGRQRRNLLAHQIRMIGRHGPCPMPDTQRVTGDGGAARPSLTLERGPGAHNEGTRRRGPSCDIANGARAGQIEPMLAGQPKAMQA